MNNSIPVKLFATLLCSALVLQATACGPSRPSDSSSTTDATQPSETEIRAAIEHGISLGSGAKIKVASFKKTDGQASNVFGVATYGMSYEANSECVDDSGCVVCPPAPPDAGTAARLWSAMDGVSDAVYPVSFFRSGGAPVPSQCKRFAKGGNLTTHGKVTLSKSEKGWTGK